jgi:integrase
MSVHPTRHSKKDALDQREFQLLLEGADEMRDYYGFHARFVILVGGRLGLRRGEMAHMKEGWLDRRRNMIVIPRKETCTNGEHGGICGACEILAKQRADHNPDITVDEARDLAWLAKTEEAAREVPYDFNPRVSLVIERFFDKYDEYPCSAQSINRRIKKAAELAEELDPSNVYPHCLRATAASYHAGRGLDVIPLQSLMGWAEVSTAHNYVTSSGENTQRALHFTHSR